MGRWVSVDFTGARWDYASKVERDRMADVEYGRLDVVIKVVGGEEKIGKMLRYLNRVFCPKKTQIIVIADHDKVKHVIKGMEVREIRRLDHFRIVEAEMGCGRPVILVLSVPNLERVLKVAHGRELEELGSFLSSFFSTLPR